MRTSVAESYKPRDPNLQAERIILRVMRPLSTPQRRMILVRLLERYKQAIPELRVGVLMAPTPCPDESGEEEQAAAS